MLSAWPLGRDLSSLTRHTPVSPEAGSILTSPLLRNINGAAGTAPDSRQAANVLQPWGGGEKGKAALAQLTWEGGNGGGAPPAAFTAPTLRPDGTMEG